MEWVHGVFVGGGTIIFVLFLGIISYLSSKRYDMSHYSQRVSYCCAFPDYLSPGWINMTNMSYDFNKVLDKPYLIRAENTSEFIEYYRTSEKQNTIITSKTVLRRHFRYDYLHPIWGSRRRDVR